MEWKTIGRPGVFGFEKEEIFKKYDSLYGKDNWRIRHIYLDQELDFLDTCNLFEISYYLDSINRPELWNDLRKNAKEVYDISPADLISGKDYSIQKSLGTHIQDIAIRNVFFYRRWEFEGDKLVQIRSCAEPFGKLLTPGRVPFHESKNIYSPHLFGWWDINSVEDFYQSNKVLQVKK